MRDHLAPSGSASGPVRAGRQARGARSRRVAGVIALAVVAVLALGALIAFTQRDRPVPTTALTTDQANLPAPQPDPTSPAGLTDNPTVASPEPTPATPASPAPVNTPPPGASSAPTGQPGASNPTRAAGQPSARPRSASPLAGVRFYIDPDTSVSRQIQQWRTSRAADAALLQRWIASQPQARGFGGWEGDKVSQWVNRYVSQAAQDGSMPVLIAYNIPIRDVGGYSKGGAASAQAYRTWIRQFAAGIGQHKAVVILEPDALVHTVYLKGEQKEERFALLADAVDVLSALPHTLTYIDAGNILGPPPAELAAMLKRVGVAKVQGFSLNVANYQATEVLRPYAEAVSKNAGGAHWVIDSGRNGLGAGPDKEAYCNVRGRGLGHPPSGDTKIPLLDAYLWVIRPGESDGTCNGDPPPGNYIGDYGLELIRLSPYTQR